MDEIVFGVTKFYGVVLAVIIGAVWVARRVKRRADGTEDERAAEKLGPFVEIAGTEVGDGRVRR